MKLHFRQFLFGVFLLIGLAFFGTSASAQTAATENKTTANENYQLNITEKHTTETDYKRSTQVSISTNDRRNLNVVVGAGVQAEKIDISLHGITGTVRFRASLELLQQRIEQLKQNRPPQNPGKP